MSLAFWVCAVVTAISAYVSLGYSIAGARGAAAGEVQVGFLYALARSFALALAATAGFFSGSVGFVAAVATVMVLVQAADALVGRRIKDRVKTFGPAATAVVNAAVLVWMLVAG